MEFKKNKVIIFNLLLALLSCAVIILIHNAGYEWYIAHFHPRSRGVGLGFVRFYILGIIIPAVFISVFIRMKCSLIMMAAIFGYMFITWYSGNPLRVILMSISACAGYGVVISGMLLKRSFRSLT